MSLFFSGARVEIKPLDGFGRMAQNARNHTRICLLALEYLILTYTPLQERQILAQNRQIQAKSKYSAGNI